MREQTGLGMRNQTGTYRPEREIAPSSGHYAELHPEDVPQQTDDQQARSMRREYLYDDGEEPQPSRSSTRRYATAIQRGTPRSLIRVTDHGQPIQRASRMRQSSTQEPQTNVPQLPQQAQFRQKKSSWLAGRHPLFYIGSVCVLFILGWFLIGALISWVSVTIDDVHYGRPRTFQTDIDVGHGGLSHFTVENVGGRLTAYDLRNHDLPKANIYARPMRVGAGHPGLTL